jgi:shikimate kinase
VTAIRIKGALLISGSYDSLWRVFMKKINIVLTGFMGVGKTEVGRRLAELLEMKFIDTDTAVESAVGMKIPDIFQKYGEERFRCEEAAVIRKAAVCSNCVIATGVVLSLTPRICGHCGKRA